jgi:hypothetical protein
MTIEPEHTVAIRPTSKKEALFSLVNDKLYLRVSMAYVKMYLNGRRKVSFLSFSRQMVNGSYIEI